MDVIIREFQPGDEAAFRRLNEEWIVRYFELEPKDVASLSDPRRTILDPGGKILIACSRREIVGCCALVVRGEREFEVAKMAVTESAQGAGVGRRLLEAVIAAARELGTRRLYLETNRKLDTAIRLYERLGFRHVPPERLVPSPYARSNVAMELFLNS